MSLPLAPEKLTKTVSFPSPPLIVVDERTALILPVTPPPELKVPTRSFPAPPPTRELTAERTWSPRNTESLPALPLMVEPIIPETPVLLRD